MKRNIGIVTWHYYNNFGSALQAYALQETLRQFGAVQLVNYHKPLFGKPNVFKDRVRFLLGYTLGRYLKRFNYGHFMFRERYLNQGRLTLDEAQLPLISKHFDIIVCGSDQIWAPSVYSPVYFASFAKPGTKKISYAASIGLNDIPDDLVPKYKENLSGFSAISVREAEGQQLLKSRCGIDSSVVLDPTLLHDSAFYVRIQRRVPSVSGKYILCYFLNGEHQYSERVKEYAQKSHLKVIGISQNMNDSSYMTLLSNIGADQFIWLINHSEAILTDSYHGAIFSLLFHKNFWLFQRFNEGDPLCQNSRIRQLKNYFSSCVRIISGNDPINENITIDYKAFEADIIPLRKHSIDYLKKSLQ